MPLKLYRRGEVWWFRGAVAGRRLHGSTKTADATTAKRIAAEREAREWKRDLDGAGAVLTFAQAHMLYLEAGKSDRYTDVPLDHWRDTLVRNITSGAIKKAAIQAYPNVGPATRNRQFITPTAAIINHAAGLDLCSTVRVKRFPVPKTAKRVADWPWVQAFMAAASPHVGALACFMFLTGSRIGNAVALDWRDVDLSQSEAILRKTKTGDDHVVHLLPELVVALANIPWREGRVFGYSSRTAPGQSWNRAIEKAGMQHINPHGLRHGFATGLLHAGVDPVTIAKHGGWKSAQMVMSVYGHAMQDKRVTERLTGPPVAHAVSPERKKA